MNQLRTTAELPAKFLKMPDFKRMITAALLLLMALAAVRAHAGKDRDGGFEYENSRVILNRASKELAQAVLEADPEIFPPFAPGWTRTKLAALIRDVRHLHDEVTLGTNPMDRRERRAFDYEPDLDADGAPVPGQGYIAALKPYFEQFRHIPVLTSESSAVEDSIREVKRRLIHEASHLVWEYNERKSLELSTELLAKLAPRLKTRNRIPLTAKIGGEDAFLALTGYELYQSRDQLRAGNHPLATERANRLCNYFGFERAVDFNLGWYVKARPLKYVTPAGELRSFTATAYRELAYFRYPPFARKPVRISEAEFDPSNSSHAAKTAKLWKLAQFTEITCLRESQAE